MHMRRYDHGGDIYRNKVELDFSVNTNPFGMPEAAKTALRENIEVCEKYPDSRCEALCRAVAEHEGVPVGSVLCGNGAADIIYRLVFAQKPKTALVCAPSFSEYERAVLIGSGKIRYHKLQESDDFTLTERILDDIKPGTDMVFICNPNNPTGKLADFTLLTAIAEKCAETGTLLVADECFLPFTNGESMKTFPNVAVIKAFTKIYAMAGLRLGYLLCGDTGVINSVRDFAQMWSVSAPAQLAGEAALGCEGFVEHTAEFIKTERDFLASSLADLGLRVIDSDANFLLVKSEKPLSEPLLERGILIRDCGNFTGLDGRWARIAVRSRDENAQLINSVKEILHG